MSGNSPLSYKQLKARLEFDASENSEDELEQQAALMQTVSERVIELQAEIDKYKIVMDEKELEIEIAESMATIEVSKSSLYKDLNAAAKVAAAKTDSVSIELKAEFLDMRRHMITILEEHRRWDSLYWQFKLRANSLDRACDMGKTGWYGWTKN